MHPTEKEPLDPEKIVQLYEAGKTLPQIAEVFRCTATRISLVLDSLGVTRRYRGRLNLKPLEERQSQNVQTDPAGYLLWFRPCHRYANANGYVRAHRLVMEEKIGRLLLPCEDVHHEDGNKQNNLPENLELTTRSEHTRLHNFPKSSARKIHEMDDAELAKIYETKSSVQIAKEYGTSPASVQRELARRGMSPGQGRRSLKKFPPDEEMILLLADKGTKLAAMFLGIRFGTLYGYLRKSGLPTSQGTAAAYLEKHPGPEPIDRPQSLPDGAW